MSKQNEQGYNGKELPVNAALCFENEMGAFL